VFSAGTANRSAMLSFGAGDNGDVKVALQVTTKQQ
jgi:hypothetical protein